MFDIALGILLYYILAAFGSFVLSTVVISLVMNFFTEAGFVENFKSVWKVIFSIFRMAIRKKAA